MLLAVSLSVGIVVALFGGWQGVLHWRANCRSDVRAAMVECRKLFGEVTAHGGRSTRTFLTPEAQALDTTLGDLAPRLNDRKLRHCVERVHAALGESWALAPPHRPAVVYPETPETEEDRERLGRVGQQVDVAHRGQDEVGGTLDRLTRLERFLVHRS